MFLVSFHIFFNWIRSVRGIPNTLPININSEIWNNVNKEINKNICYCVLIFKQLIIFSLNYTDIWYYFIPKQRFTLPINIMFSLRFLYLYSQIWSFRFTGNTCTYISVFGICPSGLLMFSFKKFMTKSRVISKKVFISNICKFVETI